MAKTSNKTTMFLNMALVLSLLLIFTFAQGRSILGVEITKAKLAAAPTCDTVVAVKSGDTCLGITEAQKLTTEFFLSINPNINCDSIFVGQWVCVDGTAN